jgi:hypothetical protein
MALDAGYRGEEADAVATMLEQEEHRRVQEEDPDEWRFVPYDPMWAGEIEVIPQFGGMLMPNPQDTLWRCGRCGWEGIPTMLSGKPSTFCPACEPDYDTLLAEIVDEEPSARSATIRRSDRKLGRNEPCWCGSGKKFKRCHG